MNKTQLWNKAFSDTAISWVYLHNEKINLDQNVNFVIFIPKYLVILEFSVTLEFWWTGWFNRTMEICSQSPGQWVYWTDTMQYNSLTRRRSRKRGYTQIIDHILKKGGEGYASMSICMHAHKTVGMEHIRNRKNWEQKDYLKMTENSMISKQIR